MRIFVLAALVVASCGSITRDRDLDGRNAYNKPGIVFIDPDAPLRAAVWAQEDYEARYKLDPVRWATIRTNRRERQLMELRSHEIEVQAAALVYGADPVAYRQREAQLMRQGYDGLFSNKTEAEIVGEMEGFTLRARKWVAENERRIRGQV